MKCLGHRKNFILVQRTLPVDSADAFQKRNERPAGRYYLTIEYGNLFATILLNVNNRGGFSASTRCGAFLSSTPLNKF
jgi:hypothetical protein